MDERSEIERMLQRLTGDPSPTPAERAAAEADLRALISTATARRPRRFAWLGSWRWVAGAAAAAVLLVVLVVVPSLQPSPAQAGLTELAEAVELLKPDVLPSGSYAYTRSEQINLAILPGSDFGLDSQFVAYLMPSTREIWRDNQGTVQLRTTNHPPTFFSPEAEQAYYQGGLDQLDQLNQPVTLTATGAATPLDLIGWSHHPDQLHQQMLDHIKQGGSDLPDHIQIFLLARQLLTETGAEPPLRAAILRVLATLDIQLIEHTPEQLRLAVTDQDIRYTITIDPTGQLLQATTTQQMADTELGIPAGTNTHQATYQSTTVDQLP